MKMTTLSAVFLFTLPVSAVEIDQTLLDSIGKDRTRWVAHAHGAAAKECFRVVDHEGRPVTNASLRCTFWMGGGASRWQSIYGNTDTNGFCTIKGVARAGMEYLVSKEGHYNSHGKVDYMRTRSVPAVIDGKWQPYSKTRTVVLKKIENPVQVSASEGLTYYKYPPMGKWTGFDLCKRDWVHPDGSGEFSDVIIRIDRKETVDGYAKTMEVSFTNNPFAGAYEVTEDSYSELKSAYRANTNASFSGMFKYTFKRGKRGNERMELPEGKHLIFRTRARVSSATLACSR